MHLQPQHQIFTQETYTLGVEGTRRDEGGRGEEGWRGEEVWVEEKCVEERREDSRGGGGRGEESTEKMGR
jgi:hypothetical protein